MIHRDCVAGCARAVPCTPHTHAAQSIKIRRYVACCFLRSLAHQSAEKKVALCRHGAVAALQRAMHVFRAVARVQTVAISCLHVLAFVEANRAEIGGRQCIALVVSSSPYAIYAATQKTQPARAPSSMPNALVCVEANRTGGDDEKRRGGASRCEFSCCCWRLNAHTHARCAQVNALRTHEGDGVLVLCGCRLLQMIALNDAFKLPLLEEGAVAAVFRCMARHPTPEVTGQCCGFFYFLADHVRACICILF
jgi:hypothetical protein